MSGCSVTTQLYWVKLFVAVSNCLLLPTGRIKAGNLLNKSARTRVADEIDGYSEVAMRITGDPMRVTTVK